jgi:lipid-A-disaccharide synthase
MSASLPRAFAPPTGGPVDLLVIAGEHSGDEQAARMVRELLAREPQLRIAALGGPELAAAGAQLLYDLTASSVVGIVEVLRNFRFFRDVHGRILDWIAAYLPRAVCLVDYPGMNLRLAEAMRRRGLSVQGWGPVKTLFYISPQIWAWKANRRFTMARDLDGLAVIFPFEVESYADTALPVEFVGHPFVAPDFQLPVRYDPEGPVLLLPGSRQQAVGRIFPALRDGHRAFGIRPGVVLYPSDEIAAVIREHLPDPAAAGITLRPIGEQGAPLGASAVLTSSGTMSLQCALAGIPGAIAYRANPGTYALGRWLVQIKYLGIANLLLNEPMYPEYVQGAATPSALAAELNACVRDSARRERTAAQAVRLRAALARPTSGTAADWLRRQLGP